MLATEFCFFGAGAGAGFGREDLDFKGELPSKLVVLSYEKTFPFGLLVTEFCVFGAGAGAGGRAGFGRGNTDLLFAFATPFCFFVAGAGGLPFAFSFRFFRGPLGCVGEGFGGKWSSELSVVRR